MELRFKIKPLNYIIMKKSAFLQRTSLMRVILISIIWSMIIFPLQTTASGSSVSANKQDKTISGKITNSSGEIVQGASIILKGTTIETNTDFNGNFSLENVSKKATLVVTSEGMKSKEINVGKNTEFIILMEDNDDVVVVGYGVQKKEKIVGSITQINEEGVKHLVNGANLSQTLTGQIPGLTILHASGEPGGLLDESGLFSESASSMYIRGRNSWNGGQPLVLIDGVERNMNNIDISEVASISILKDASATAVYGVKGANGVILITTKRY